MSACARQPNPAAKHAPAKKTNAGSYVPRRSASCSQALTDGPGSAGLSDDTGRVVQPEKTPCQRWPRRSCALVSVEAQAAAGGCVFEVLKFRHDSVVNLTETAA